MEKKLKCSPQDSNPRPPDEQTDTLDHSATSAVDYNFVYFVKQNFYSTFNFIWAI